MKLILVRHGQTRWNVETRIQGRTDTELNGVGRAQALALGRRLCTEPIAAIYTSPLKRARETAAALNAGCDIIPMGELIELDFGLWEGMRFFDVAAQYPDLWLEWKADPSRARIPGAESMERVKERCLQAVNSVTTKHTAQETVLLISHTMPIKLIIAHYLGLPYENLHRFRLDNCAISEIELPALEQGRLITLNETGFLNGTEEKA